MASAVSFPDVGSRVTLRTSCGKVVVAAMKKSPAGKKVAGSRLELQLACNRDRGASIFLVGMRTEPRPRCVPQRGARHRARGRARAHAYAVAPRSIRDLLTIT